MFSNRRLASSTLVKDVALLTFVGVRRTARIVRSTPSVARSVARDVRDAWQESAAASPTAAPADPNRPF